jgi:hypothetical protein
MASIGKANNRTPANIPENTYKNKFYTYDTFGRLVKRLLLKYGLKK